MNKKLRTMINRCDCVIIPDFGRDVDNIRFVGPIVRTINDNRENLRKNGGYTSTHIFCGS